MSINLFTDTFFEFLQVPYTLEGELLLSAYRILCSIGLMFMEFSAQGVM